MEVAALAVAAAPAHATTITTTFAANNNYTGNFFNITTDANALDVTGMTVNVDTGPMTIDIYDRIGGYAGSERNSSAWTLVSQTAVTGLGAGQQTPVAVTPFVLPADELIGMYVTIDSNVNAPPHMYYTNGSNTYNNADLTITTGEGAGGLFGSLALITSRTWNGSITYSVVSTPEPASISVFATAGLGLILSRRRSRRR